MDPAEQPGFRVRPSSCTLTVPLRVARDCSAWRVPGLVAGGKEKAIPRLRATTSGLVSCSSATTDSTHHFNTIADLVIVVGFFRDQWDFKKIVGKGRRLDLPLQSGSPPRIRSCDLPVLQRPEEISCRE